MTVQRFRKPPVEVLAVQWDGTNIAELDYFTAARFDAFTEPDPDDPEATAAVLDARHSTWVLMRTGDWVVKGVQGEFYPCRDDVFRATYEPAPGFARGEMATVRPGERFVLTDRTTDSPRVMYRGTLLQDGGAELDVIAHKGIEPVVVTAAELFNIYDPDIHRVTVIGSAV